MSESMFDLVGKYKTLIDLASSDDDLDQITIQDTIEAIVGEILAKTDNCVDFLDVLDGRINTVERRMEREKLLLKNLKATQSRVTKSIQNMMLDTGNTQIGTGAHKIKLVRNGGKASLKYDIPEIDIPEEYTKKKIEIVPDNDKIRKGIENGEVDFAHLERGYRLKID